MEPWLNEQLDREDRCGTSASVLVPGGPVWNLDVGGGTGRSGVEPRRLVRIPGGPVWNLARVSVRTGRSGVEPRGRCERLAPGAAPALVYVTSSTGPHRPHRTRRIACTHRLQHHGEAGPPCHKESVCRTSAVGPMRSGDPHSPRRLPAPPYLSTHLLVAVAAFASLWAASWVWTTVLEPCVAELYRLCYSLLLCSIESSDRVWTELYHLMGEVAFNSSVGGTRRCLGPRWAVRRLSYGTIGASAFPDILLASPYVLYSSPQGRRRATRPRSRRRCHPFLLFLLLLMSAGPAGVMATADPVSSICQQRQGMCHADQRRHCQRHSSRCRRRRSRQQHRLPGRVPQRQKKQYTYMVHHLSEPISPAIAPECRTPLGCSVCIAMVLVSVCRGGRRKSRGRDQRRQRGRKRIPNHRTRQQLRVPVAPLGHAQNCEWIDRAPTLQSPCAMAPAAHPHEATVQDRRTGVDQFDNAPMPVAGLHPLAEEDARASADGWHPVFCHDAMDVDVDVDVGRMDVGRIDDAPTLQAPCAMAPSAHPHEATLQDRRTGVDHINNAPMPVAGLHPLAEEDARASADGWHPVFCHDAMDVDVDVDVGRMDVGQIDDAPTLQAPCAMAPTLPTAHPQEATVQDRRTGVDQIDNAPVPHHLCSSLYRHCIGHLITQFLLPTLMVLGGWAEILAMSWNGLMHALNGNPVGGPPLCVRCGVHHHPSCCLKHCTKCGGGSP